MSVDGPDFHAWCDAEDRSEALAAALAAFVRPGDTCDVWGRGQRVSLDAALAAIRAGTVPFSATAWLVLTSGRELLFDLHYRPEKSNARGTLHAAPDDRRRLLDWRIQVAYRTGPASVNAKRGARPDQVEALVEVEAALLTMVAQQDIEEILIRLCAPSSHKLVTTGACTEANWNAAVETYATYHADGEIARDLALSWLHLHNGMPMTEAAGLSMDALQALVDAAPGASRVAVARDVERRNRYFDMEAKAEWEGRRAGLKLPPRAVRFAMPGDDELTREHVLAALSTPAGALLEALEASAVPDAEWRAAAPVAIETAQAMIRGAPTYDVDVTTQQHVRWIEQHAPYHVRRLPNGGVVLATHPHRILWPLWADALSLLGIRDEDGARRLS